MDLTAPRPSNTALPGCNESTKTPHTYKLKVVPVPPRGAGPIPLINSILNESREIHVLILSR